MPISGRSQASGDEHCANAGDEWRCEMLDGVDETKLTLNEGSGLEVAKRRNGEGDGHADDREHVSTPGQRISVHPYAGIGAQFHPRD